MKIISLILKIITWPFRVIIRIISWLTGGWADSLDQKFMLTERAANSRLRAWANSLTGWKYWAWQIGVGVLIFAVFEWFFNLLGYTILPWRMF